MMATSPSVEALLDRDWRTLSPVEWRIFAEAFPEQYPRLLVRLEPHVDADARTRTSRVTRHRHLAERLEASVPFEISVVTL